MVAIFVTLSLHQSQKPDSRTVLFRKEKRQTSQSFFFLNKCYPLQKASNDTSEIVITFVEESSKSFIFANRDSSGSLSVRLSNKVLTYLYCFLKNYSCKGNHKFGQNMKVGIFSKNI